MMVPCTLCGTPTASSDLNLKGHCKPCAKLQAKVVQQVAPQPKPIDPVELVIPETPQLIELDEQLLAAEQADRFDKIEEAKREKAMRELARRHLLPFVMRFNPDYMPGWVHADICQKLEQFSQDIADKKSPRLMISMPPRSGKSELCSKNFPSWHLGHYPKHEIIQATYASDLALDFSRKIREQMKSKIYQGLFETRVDPKSQALERWMTTAGGAYAAVGVRGPITGRGAHCFPAGTLVETPSGAVEIQDLASGMCVLTCDLVTGKIGESYVVANRKNASNRLVTITTDTGKRIRATLDHRFYIPAVGWVEAQYLRAGDAVAIFNGPDTLCPLRDVGRDDPCGFPEESQSGQHGGLLQSAMPRERVEETLRCSRLQQPDSGESKFTELEVLFPRMQDCLHTQTFAEDLSDLRDGVPANLVSNRILFAKLCERGPQLSDDGAWQLAIQRWDELRSVVSEYETSDTPEGQQLLRHLWQLAETRHTPYRPSATEQRGSESYNDVQNMPSFTPSLDVASISSVNIDSGTEEYVYDIQVAGTSCFFAESILVHNCAIIDDPVKDRVEAESEVMRQQVKDWYSSTFYTRLAPGGGVLVIMTRWHEDDLSGWLCKLFEEAEAEADATGEWPKDADRWEIINYPAIAEEDEKYRKKGEALHPERYPVEALMRIKRALLPRDWAALYQQRPSVADGDFFKRGHFKHYAPNECPPLKDLNIYAAWDQALGKKNTNDFTVCVIVGISRTGDLYVLHVLRGRWTSLEIIEKMMDVQQTWKPLLQGVEESMIEMAIEPMLIKIMTERKKFIPYIKLKHKGMDKVARAQSIRARVEQGRVWLPREQDANWVSIFLDELMKFPGGKHDDQADAFAWIGFMILYYAAKHDVKEDKTPEWMKRLKHKRTGKSAMSA